MKYMEKKAYALVVGGEVHNSIDGRMACFVDKTSAKEYMGMFGKPFLRLMTIKIKRVTITIEE